MALSTVQECLSQLKWLWYSGASRPMDDVETYDRASRGLVGSVQLLWKLRFTPAASFGALLTVAHLAITPLAQQSLLSVSVPVVALDAKATIPITKSWLELSQQTQALNLSDDYASISPGMKSAVLNGLFASANVTINDTLPTCTTGNCTFPAYQSLALCASTANVTTHLKNDTTDQDIKWCLPGDFCASNTRSKTGRKSITATVISAVTQADKKKGEEAEPKRAFKYTSLAFADHPAPVGNFYIIYNNVTKGINGAVETPWAAVELVLDWCVPTFDTQVANGTPSTSRQPNSFTSFDPENGDNLIGNTGGEDFSVHLITHNSLERYLDVSLSGRAYLQEATTSADSDEVQKLVSFFGIGDNRKTLAEGLAALDEMLTNTATSMSNYIRSGQNREVANGTAFVQQNVVRVRWAWVAAPVVFCAASLLFFVTVVVLCSLRRTAKPPLWKSHAVATLRCLDPELHRELGSLLGRTSLSCAAGKESVRLVQDGDGWLLVRGLKK
ncbi:hypothetical protein N0V95_010070 [Ascochyta clinopodiicola]|nr:hypothetical protein N0V95_010070 [Ascochyta clinopodiicola]